MLNLSKKNVNVSSEYFTDIFNSLFLRFYKLRIAYLYLFYSFVPSFYKAVVFFARHNSYGAGAFAWAYYAAAFISSTSLPALP